MRNSKFFTMRILLILSFFLSLTLNIYAAETPKGTIYDITNSILDSAKKGENLGVISSEYKGEGATNTEEPKGSYAEGDKVTITTTDKLECIGNDGKPSDVEYIDVTFSATERLTDYELYEAYAESMGLSTDEYTYDDYRNYVGECFDLGLKYAELSNAFAAKMGTTITVRFAQNETTGEWICLDGWPAELADSGLFAITEIGIVLENKDVFSTELKKGQFVFFDAGKEKTSPDPVPGQKDDTETKEYAYASISNRYFTHMEPASVSGNIVAKDDKYDVTKGIPTSEMLKLTATADEALYNIGVRTWTAYAGVKDVSITTTINYYYKDCPHWSHQSTCKYLKTRKTQDCDCNQYQLHGSERYPGCYGTTSKTHSNKYSTSKSAIFYDVPMSSIYPVTRAYFSGMPTESGKATIGLNGNSGPGPMTLSYKRNLPKYSNQATAWVYEGMYDANKVYNSLYERVCNNIDAACLTAAQTSLKGTVNYSYNGLRVTKTYSNNKNPNVGTVSNSLERVPDTFIPSDKHNGNYPTGGTVWYSNGNSYGFNPNDVFVHTPVVNKTKITVEKFVNQKINKDTKVTYLQLDKQFTIRIPDDGQHISEKGYGNRKYNTNGNLTITPKETSWGKEKTIMIPFDVYRHNSDGTTTFIPAKEVQKVKGNTDYTYTIPAWVWEDKYTIETRVIAENKQNDNAEVGANLNSNNYIAKQDIPVEIVGKIYDLRVSSSNDPAWYNNIKGEYITDKDFPFGQQGQNKVPSYKYAPKLGYTFVFDFKTKGRKSNNIDVSAYPEFYFVSKNGGSAKKVDLYYNTVNEKCVKINEQDARVPLIVKYNDTYMKVPSQEKIDTNKIYKTKYNYNLGVNVGTFANMHLPHDLRLCYNNFDEYVGKLYGKNATKNSIINDATKVTYADETNGGENIVIGSVGHWFAGYRLPASTIAVDPGTKVTPSNVNSVKKVDGYILVKMNIKTNYQSWSYLKYTGPEGLNENANIPTPDWEKTYDPSNPSNHQDITLPNGNPADVPNGTIIIYDSDLRSTNDAETSGTH